MRNRAFREYISTMVDCDHITGEKAKTSAAATPPENAKSEFVLPHSAFCASSLGFIMSMLDRHMSMAVQPAANAPVTAENSDIAHAGVGCPMYVTHENSRQNTHPHMLQNGYPGG